MENLYLLVMKFSPEFSPSQLKPFHLKKNQTKLKSMLTELFPLNGNDLNVTRSIIDF